MEKMFRGPQFNRKKLLCAAIHKKINQDKLNLIKIYNFARFVGCSRARCGPRTACLRPLQVMGSQQSSTGDSHAQKTNPFGLQGKVVLLTIVQICLFATARLIMIC
jgi:hypothetical protein